MTPIPVGCFATLVVVTTLVALLLGVALHKHKKATGLYLVGRIAETINRAGASGKIIRSPTIANAHLMQATIASHEITVECSWPTDWSATQSEYTLPLVRMFVGHIGPAPWTGYRQLSFTISHGLGANEGHAAKHMLMYTISGESALGKQVYYAGTLMQEQVELPVNVQKLSETIASIERRLSTQTPS